MIMMVKINSKALISKRQEKKYSQRKLSILAGLSDNAIFRMENKSYMVIFLELKLLQML